MFAKLMPGISVAIACVATYAKSPLSDQYVIKLQIQENGMTTNDIQFVLDDSTEMPMFDGKETRYVSGVSTTTGPTGTSNSPTYGVIQTGVFANAKLLKQDKSVDNSVGVHLDLILNKLLDMKEFKVGDQTLQMPTVQTFGFRKDLFLPLGKETQVLMSGNTRSEISLFVSISKVDATNNKAESHCVQKTINSSPKPNLHFNYRVSGDCDADFAPISVFDDGKFTYFNLANSAPVPLIVKVDRHGRYSIVDFKFDSNEHHLVAHEISKQFALIIGSEKVIVSKIKPLD